MKASTINVGAFLILHHAKRRQPKRYHFARIGLLLCTWMYFLLNYAFFRFPWPWAEWTGRTPNGIIFTVCAVGLTLAALIGTRRDTILSQ